LDDIGRGLTTHRPSPSRLCALAQANRQKNPAFSEKKLKSKNAKAGFSGGARYSFAGTGGGAGAVLVFSFLT